MVWDWTAGRALWDAGIPIMAIADSLGCGHQTVRRYADKHWPRRERSTLFCRSAHAKEPQSVTHRCDRCRGTFSAPVDHREHIDCPRARRVAA